MMVTPTGWDISVRPEDITQRVLGAVGYIERWYGLVDAGTEIALDSPINVMTNLQQSVLLAYLELHFGVQIPVDAAETWQTPRDILETIAGLAPRSLPEAQGLEIELQDVLVAVNPDRQHYSTPLVPMQNLFGREPAPLDGRVVLRRLSPTEVVGLTSVNAGGIRQVVTEVEPTAGWVYIQATMLLVYRPVSDHQALRQWAGRNWAVTAVHKLLPSLVLVEPGGCLVDHLPERR